MNHERITNKHGDYKPLLIFKIGVLGCAPLDMPARLADAYDAQFFSSDHIRKELIDANDAAGRPDKRINNKEIRRKVYGRAVRALNKGEDAVVDMFYNTVNSRKHPLSMAQCTGALTVALWINTPFSQAFQRVRQWTEEEAFAVPTSRWEVPPYRAARAMMDHVEWPDNEGVDYVFNLDGTGTTADILDQFDAKLAHYGLLDRYEDGRPAAS